MDPLLVLVILKHPETDSAEIQMDQEQENNPLHGKSLEVIVKHLVDHFGWKELGNKININCFKSNPSIKSSLTFLRKAPWAREKVENLYKKII